MQNISTRVALLVLTFDKLAVHIFWIILGGLLSSGNLEWNPFCGRPHSPQLSVFLSTSVLISQFLSPSTVLPYPPSAMFIKNPRTKALLPVFSRFLIILNFTRNLRAPDPCPAPPPIQPLRPPLHLCRASAAHTLLKTRRYQSNLEPPRHFSLWAIWTSRHVILRYTPMIPTTLA